MLGNPRLSVGKAIAGNRRRPRGGRPCLLRGTRRWVEALEPRVLLAGDSLVISELMALNTATLPDQDGDYSDWLEIYNPTADDVDLHGWYLTDNSARLTQWPFPDGTLAVGERKVVFVSEKDRAGPELHTNFKLKNEGEYLALTRDDGQGGVTVEFAYSPKFPAQVADVSYGLAADLTTRGFFLTPTPGDANPEHALSSPEGRVVINEIMYHPGFGEVGSSGYVPEDTRKEYIELFNPTETDVPLLNWQLEGVGYTFGDVTLQHGQYLIVAADVATFNASYTVPGGTTVVGGWTGQLGDGGETIRLRDSVGGVHDKVAYADEGDWAQRARGPLDHSHYGWVWSSGADAGRKSLELINAAMPNEYGQNWAASGPDGGTPGAANSAAATNIAPVILDVSQSPAIPRSTDAVIVTARARDELAAGVTMSLSYRVDGAPSFTSITMVDDGLHGDEGADDGVFGATIPAKTSGTVVEFFVGASDAGAHTRTWPAPTQPTGQQLTNLLYQVDDTYDPTAVWAPGSQPIYRLIMTDAERAELRDIGLNDGDLDHWSSAQMNGTVVALDGTGIEMEYQVGIRNRGHGTRRSFEGNANNYKISIPHDRSWNGLEAIDINYNYSDAQAMGSAILQMAGLAAPNQMPVQVRVNGANLAVTGARMYGSYAQKEDYNGEFAAGHFPDDSDGNLYLVHYSFNDNNNILDHGDLRWEGTDPSNYRDCYLKQTNVSQDDYSDLIHMLDVLNRAPDATLLQQVSEVIDINQWMRYIAADSLIGNLEGSLGTGLGDDYAMYRGTSDTRFVLVPWDMDTILGVGDSGSQPTRGIFDGYMGITGLSRLLNNADIIPLYYAQLVDLINTTFAAANFDPLVDKVLGSWVPPATVAAVKQFTASRITSVLSQIRRAFAISSGLPTVNGYRYTTSATASLNGTADAVTTRSVRVNGQAAGWNARTGEWTMAAAGLVPGINRVVVQAFDGPNGTGNVVQEGFIDIHFNDGSVVAVSGTIATDTTWTAADGPYQLAGNVTVPVGVTLTIQPGTTVFFDAAASLTVNGRIVAEGTQYQQIRFASTPGAAVWSGLQIVNTMQDNRLSYTVLEYGQTDNGMLGVDHSNATIDHCYFDHSERRRIRFQYSSIIVRNSIFTDIFPGTGGPSTDNMSEQIWGGHAPTGGHVIIEGNTFGRSKGHNDACDIDGGTYPTEPVMVFRNNRFLGGGDDAMDLEGDALIEGNIFTHFHRDQWNTGAGNSNGTSAGAGHTYTFARNVYLDMDYLVQVKDDAYVYFVDNTAQDVTLAGLYFQRPGVNPGRGAYVDGSVFVNVPQTFESVVAGVDLVVNRSILPAAFHHYGTGNIDADARLTDPLHLDFTLLPGSPALGAGPNGLDMGAMVPQWVSIAGEPEAVTRSTSATLTIGGPGITHYKYRLNGGGWSAEIPVATPIQLDGLPEATYTVSVMGKNVAGQWQDEAQATASKSWTVDTSSPHVRINEVLAINAAAVPHEGTYPDLVELHNYGATTIDLSGMSLSDDPATPDKYVFPAGTQLGAGQYLVLYADSETTASGLHLGFALEGSGDGVYLYDTPGEGGALLDSVDFGLQIADYSVGRVGQDAHWALNQPSFGSANVAQPTGNPATLKINEWLASEDILFTDDSVELYNPDPLPVPLGGLYLTDNFSSQPDRHRIAALSYVAGCGAAAFWADGNVDQGPSHLSFQLSAGQGLLGLYDANLKAIDRLMYYPQTADTSQGRGPDGGQSLSFFDLPTLGIRNSVPVTTTVNLISVDDVWSYDDSGTNLYTAWREPGYNDAAWRTGQGVLGWEDPGLMLPAPIKTVLATDSVKPTFYFRRHFTLDGDPATTTLTLQTLIDDAAALYINGHEVYRVGLDGEVTFESRSNRSVVDAAYEGPFTISTAWLQPGDNVFAVEVHQNSSGNRDLAMGLILQATLTTIVDPQIDRGQKLVDGLRVAEIMYNPADNTGGEYVELQNVGATALDLTGVRLTQGIDFTFPPMLLAPQQRVVVVGNREAFERCYGSQLNVAGQFSGNLSNGGEDLVLKLAAPLDAAILRFQYDDNWYPTTDGDGFALNVRDPAAKPAVWQDRDQWQAGSVLGGTPGTADGSAVTSIRINEVLSSAAGAQTNAIELYNPSDMAVNIGNWFLSNSSRDYLKFQIPAGTVVPAHGYAVFTSDAFNPNPANPGPKEIALSAAHGDDLFLAASDGSGKVTQFVDHVAIGASKPGESFGRWPSGSGPMYPMVAATLDPIGAENAGPRVGPLVISEIMYNPGNMAGSDDIEYIEVFNPTSESVDLTNWRIGQGATFDFPDDTLLAAHDALLVVPFDVSDSVKLGNFRNRYGLVDGSVQIVGGYAGQLANEGDRIQLQRAGEPAFIPYTLEDEVVFGVHAPWPTDANGSGDSLHRLGTTRWGNDAASWTAAPPTPGVTTLVEAPRVVDRRVFYNNSAFDGGDDAPNDLDDSAIAPDKTALLPGATASFSNYTSFSKGLNGLIVDIAGLPSGVTLSGDDLLFRTGNDSNPNAWLPAPQPQSITIRRTAGKDGSDRVTVIWADGAIRNKWLQVTVDATDDTGLASPDLFYFGNAVGETGNSTGDAKVTASDILLVRANPRNALNPAPIDFAYDFNRDGRVDATDILMARDNQTTVLNALRLIHAPLAAPGSPMPAPSFAAPPQAPAESSVALAVTTGRAAGSATQPKSVSLTAANASAVHALDWLYDVEPRRRSGQPSFRRTVQRAVDEVLGRF